MSEQRLKELTRLMAEDLGDFNHEKALTTLVQAIGLWREEVDAVLLQHAGDQDRVMVHLLEGSETLPDVWLLGWRTHEIVEATEVHDHCYSKAAVHIYRGDVREVAFEISPEHWNRGEAMESGKSSRILLEGSTLLIHAPYIHAFEATEGFSASIHAYFPALREMILYRDENGVLVPLETWGHPSPEKRVCSMRGGQ